MIWIWLLITVFGDIFRRRDVGGVMKAFWIIFVIVLPYVGVLIYVLVEYSGMADRSQRHGDAAPEQQADSSKPVVSSASPVDQIAKAKSLLDSGAIVRPSSTRSRRKYWAETRVVRRVSPSGQSGRAPSAGDARQTG